MTKLPQSPLPQIFVDQSSKNDSQVNRNKYILSHKLIGKFSILGV